MWKQWADVMAVDGKAESRLRGRLRGNGQRNSKRPSEGVIHSRRQEATHCARSYREMVLPWLHWIGNLNP